MFLLTIVNKEKINFIFEDVKIAMLATVTDSIRKHFTTFKQSYHHFLFFFLFLFFLLFTDLNHTASPFARADIRSEVKSHNYDITRASRNGITTTR